MSRKLTKKILLLGGSGQIGSQFLKLSKSKYNVISPGSLELDIRNKKKVFEYIDRSNPDQIIYSIGFTSIDNAPSNQIEALELNVLGIDHVAKSAAKKNIPVHYLSTEVVFDGNKTAGPYIENDPPNPLSLNAQFKRLGELVTLDASKKNSVIRLIICYSAFYSRKSDIARMVIKNLKEGKEFTTTTDQEINPVFVNHLIYAIFKIIDKGASGIYHVGAKDYTTPFEFCRFIALKMGLDQKLIKGIKFKEFSKSRPEPRPQHEWLDVSKFLKEFGKDSLHTVEEGLEQFIEEFNINEN